MSIKVLGISAFYHDSAAAITEDGRILAAAQEERFTRKKHDPGFPSRAVAFCLKQSGFALQDLDAVVFYDKPLLKFERLLETYYAFAPRGYSSFAAAAPVWLKEKLFLRRMIAEKLAEISGGQKQPKLLFTSHHLSHAASAYYPSPFEKAAILTLDGVGEWATASISLGEGSAVKMLKELKFPHSVGLLYSAFTYYLGFRVNSGEYKLMGLAPYGAPGSESVKNFERLIKENLASVKDDGSVFLNQDYFDYATGLKMTRDAAWEKLFGFGPRGADDELQQRHCDLAMAIQNVTEEIVLKMAAEARRLTGAENLCLAGGVALNCVANGKLLRSKIFKDIWLQPAAGDAGGALGAALAATYGYFGAGRRTEPGKDAMAGSYLGPEFSDLDIQNAAARYQAPYTRFDDFGKLSAAVAGLLAKGNVAGWFQGRMEWGPRALGNRTILGDCRDREMQKRLNLKIKYREGFRPFAPSVLWERTKDYFDIDSPSPYMLLIADVVQARRNPLPEGYHDKPLWEKLYFVRSDVPSITHLDYSARLQTVHKETNPRYWELIEAFRRETGYGLLVNTSFNVRGEPIVCTPEDAYRCFMRTEMDYLVMGDFLFEKKAQPHWDDKSKWKEEYTLD